ncbi:MAG: recombinase family protein [Candidatus Binatus sp.]
MGRRTERAWHLNRLSNREQFCCASGGIQHQVIVRQDGIVFRGKPYKSLSVVAYRITGTKWSGPTTAGYRAALIERPALRSLLADIAEGLIDVVVVYKVDRLTRSLAGFAKMVELFDAHGVSFVAVTQQFNTTTSMGRLTLNVQLSFAQFEREVTGERIRDKIAASKHVPRGDRYRALKLGRRESPPVSLDDGITVTLRIGVQCSRAGLRTSSNLDLSRFVPPQNETPRGGDAHHHRGR